MVYPDLKNFYPIQVIDLGFQVDLINPQKNHLFEENEHHNRQSNARLFAILIKYRVMKIISDGHKITQVEVI